MVTVRDENPQKKPSPSKDSSAKPTQVSTTTKKPASTVSNQGQERQSTFNRSNDKKLSVLDRISPVGAWRKGLRIVVYGNTKTGKTRFIGTFPKPILLIGSEDGTDSLLGVDGIHFVRIYTSEDFAELMKFVRHNAKGRAYKTVALDTAGGLQDIVLKEVLGLDEVPISKNWGMTDQTTWGVIGTQMKEHLKSILDLSEEYGTHTPIIAHERQMGGDTHKMDSLGPTFGPALAGASATFLNGQCNYIVQTFKRMKTVKTKMGGEDGTEPIEVETATEEVEYCMRIRENSTHLLGFRKSPRAPELPKWIVNPTYKKIMQLVEVASGQSGNSATSPPTSTDKAATKNSENF